MSLDVDPGTRFTLPATTRALGLPAAFSLTACRFARVSARAALAFAVLLTARLADRFLPVPVAS